MRMLNKVSGKERLLFVTMPDVVGNAEKTKELFKEWFPRICSLNVPIAFVLQNNVVNDEITLAKYKCGVYRRRYAI
jgi:hypothetical protein